MKSENYKKIIQEKFEIYVSRDNDSVESQQG